MSKFKFKFENYLNLRTKLEDKCKSEYIQLKSNLDYEKNILDKLILQKQKILEEQKQLINIKFEPYKIIDFYNYLEVIKNKILDQQKVIKKVDFLVQKARDALILAVKQRQILEKLKEKEKMNYNKEQQLIEQKFYDEIVSFKYKNHIQD